MDSLEHLFFSCPLIQSGNVYAQSSLFRASPLAPSINGRWPSYAFWFQRRRASLYSTYCIFCYFLNVCKFLVCCQRNDHRFRRERPDALRLLACLTSRASFYLPLFFKSFVSQRRRRYFRRQWGVDGVVGSVSGAGLESVFF